MTRARHDLWATLEAAPDEVLSRPLIGGPGFQRIKDLVFRTAGAEDGGLHSTIRGDQPVQVSTPVIRNIQEGPSCAGAPLEALPHCWRTVEESTPNDFASLTDLDRLVDDSPTETFKLGGPLWHVMSHEMRHTAQMALLLRMQGGTPPALDLFFCLPNLHGAQQGA